MKRCPKCGKQFPDDANFCPNDAGRLEVDPGGAAAARESVAPPASGEVLQQVTTEQKALTNAVFGRGADDHWLYLTSSDMDRVTGYIYRVQVDTPGIGSR